MLSVTTAIRFARRSISPSVNSIRWYTKPRRFARVERGSNPTSLTHHDLELFEGYLENTNFGSLKSTEAQSDNRIVSGFRYTGRRLSELVSSTLRNLSDATDSDPAEDTVARQRLTEKEWVLLSKVKLYLKTSNDRSLYDILRRNRVSIPTLVDNLSRFHVSLIIKRLTDYQMEIMKRFIAEQQFSSRLRKDSDIVGLAQMKDKTYNGVRTSILKISQHAHLNTLDYETIVTFCMRNLRFRDAIDVISDLETRIREGDTSLSLTNSLWGDKIGILSRSNEQTWTIDRYDLKSNRAQLIPEGYVYPVGETDILQLLGQYRESGLILDQKMCKTIVLALGKSKNLSKLDSFIQGVWGVDTNSGELVEGFTMPSKDSMVYPNFDLLRCIELAYSFNSQLLKPLLICNTIVQKYGLTSQRSQKYWATVLECTALQCENVYRDTQTELWRKGDESDLSEVDLRRKIFDHLWQHIMTIITKPSKAMIKLRLSHGSLESLLEDLPQIRERSIDPKINITSSEAAYNENILFSYLNTCRIGLMKKREFYQAEHMITQFSINNRMKDVLLKKLSNYQQRYLKRMNQERVRARQQIRDDDDDDGMFGFW
ncbi:DEKNAAC102621 [Brettanomyces naardenensis]|uniref:ATPase expression protein 2, mitochondrial n=1 Tax=Brettanomyces naardenensis TaxID=13370 RepID=A0A448YKE3_BRENA|nr:DEKNAAC102621 [Brettanomyces naardenensis]